MRLDNVLSQGQIFPVRAPGVPPTTADCRTPPCLAGSRVIPPEPVNVIAPQKEGSKESDLGFAWRVAVYIRDGNIGAGLNEKGRFPRGDCLVPGSHP
jgi:hypothetical protein